MWKMYLAVFGFDIRIFFERYPIAKTTRTRILYLGNVEKNKN